MKVEYKTVNITFKKRWTNSELNTVELDQQINDVVSTGWALVSVSVSTLLGYPQSALCAFKKEMII